MNDSQKMHGYVHGHIHRHKDHTHIHGHIHSHDKSAQEHLPDELIPQDHKYDTNDGSSASSSTGSNFNADTNTNTSTKSNPVDDLINCPLDHLPSCEEILCSELDDCYYSNCHDADVDECCTSNIDALCECLTNDELQGLAQGHDHSTVSGTNELHESKETICNDPNCLQNGDSTICCYDESHTKNHDNNLCLNVNDTKVFTQIFAEFQKDYNRSIGNFGEEATVSDDVVPSKQDSLKEKELSSALSSFIDSKDIHYPHEIHPINNIHKALFHTNINEPNVYNGNELADFDFYFRFNNQSEKKAPKLEELNLESEKSKQSFPCKWDNNCFSSVSDDTFLDHIVNGHFKNQTNNGSDINCEWGNCGHSFDSVDAFLEHVNSHKLDSNVNILTPESTNSTAELNNSLTPKVSPNLSIVYGSNSGQTSQDESKVNIFDLQIDPKKSKHPIDANFTCQWDMGKGPDNNPIICNRTHSSTGELQDHLINDHIGSGKSSYNCQWVGCDRHNGKSFPQRQKLLRHVHIHTNHKPWKCDICGSSFAVESMLTQHLRIHSGEKPFECNICGKRFATSSSLSIHHRVHTGEKPLECKYPGCNKKFSESSNLTKHMRTHLRQFPCKICGEVFDKKSGYLRHMQMHQGMSMEEIS